MKNGFGLFYAIALSAAVSLLPFGAHAQDIDYSRQFSAQQTPPSAPPVLPRGSIPIPAEELRATDPLDLKELQHFVQDWLKYTRWIKSSGNEYKAVAYLGVSPSTDYPVEVVKWMDSHGWSVDRFFLLEQKIRRTIAVQKQEAKQTLLRQQAERIFEESNSDENLSSLERKSLKKRYSAMLGQIRASVGEKAPVTPEEYELIKQNQDVLDRILAK